MTQGFLLFAYDNEDIDYGTMAVGCAKRIKVHLDKPVSLVTDAATIKKLDQSLPTWRNYFDQIIDRESNAHHLKKYIDAGKELTFHNLNRIYSWELTPYDETIVIDTDVVIQSSMLNKLWNIDNDLMVCDKSDDIINRPSDEFNFISTVGVKFFWATTFYFKKTDSTKIFFDMCKSVKETYSWYKNLFGITSSTVRNDYIWSIALHNLGGEAGAEWVDTIPWNIPYSPPNDKILKINENAVQIMSKDPLLVKVSNRDIHIMNKIALTELYRDELGINNV